MVAIVLAVHTAITFCHKDEELIPLKCWFSLNHWLKGLSSINVKQSWRNFLPCTLCISVNVWNVSAFMLVMCCTCRCAMLCVGMVTVTSPPTRQVGSIADLDPVNNFYGSLTTDYRPPATGSGSSANSYTNHHVSTPISNQNQQTKLTSSGVRWNACYKSLILCYTIYSCHV